MKRGKVLMAVLVVMAVLFASCSNGLSEGDAAVAKLAPVNLTVNFQENGDAAQKAIAIDAPENGYTYWVKAKAEWTGSNTHNDFANWTRIAYSGAQSDVGYFTPGTWTFTVHIMAGNAEATTYDESKVVYSGSTTSVIAIGKATTEVPITVSKYNDTGATVGTGTVVIKVAVPAVTKDATSGEIVAPDLTIQYGSVSEASVSAGTENKKVTTEGVELFVGDTHGTVAADVQNWYYFTQTINGLAPNPYTFVLKYYDKSTTGKQQIGGATVSLIVRSGEQYGIYGTIENGEYQIAEMTITMPDPVTVTISTNDATEDQTTHTYAPVLSGTSVTFTANPSPSVADGTTLKWLINGEEQTSTTTSMQFIASHGVYEVTCVATKGDATAYHTRTIIARPPVIIISRVGDAGANVSNITTAQTLVCRPSVYIPGATYKWYVGSDTANATTGNSYSFTNSTAGTYVINCQVLDGSNNVIRAGSKSITVQ